MNRRVRHLNPAQFGAAVAMDVRFLTGFANNDPVGTWASRAPATATASITGTSRPTYLTSNYLGNPALQFDGVDDRMDFDAAGMAVYNGASFGYLLVVAVTDGAGDTTQSAGFWSTGTTAGSARISNRIRNTTATATTNGRRTDGDASSTTTTASGTTSTPVVLGAVADWANNALMHSVNGVESASVAYSSGGGAASSTNSLVARLGSVTTGGTRLQGRMFAVTACATSLSAAQRKRLRHHYGFSFRIPTA